MDEKLQLRVQRYGWDRASGSYDRGWRRQLAPCHRRVLELADLRPDEDVLDVACGTGLVTLPAARAVGSGGQVAAVDLSAEMVETVRGRAARAGHRHVTAWRAPAESLDVRDERFNAVLCSLGLMYVPDPLAALREMRRVLRPGGRAVVSVWGARDRCGWADIFPIVDARVRSEVCPLFFSLGTGDALARHLQEAGYRDVTAERFSTELRYQDEDEAIVAAFEGGAVALAYDRFDPGTREKAHREYLGSIEDYRDGDGHRIPGEFVVARGRR